MSCNCNSNISRQKKQIKKAIRSGVRSGFNEKKSPKIKEVVREAVREILTEDDDYQDFVRGVMQTLGIESPQDLTEEGRERFFNVLGNNYNENTDEADDVPMEELKSTFTPEHFKNQEDVPDFLKKQNEEIVRESVRNALQNLLR